MNTSSIAQKLWNYCNVLRDDGMSCGDYVEQLAYLLFLKISDERTKAPYKQESPVSMGYFLHGLSLNFRRHIFRKSARIAKAHVLIFDYGCDGGCFVRFIEWVEGPNDPALIAEDRA